MFKATVPRYLDVCATSRVPPHICMMEHSVEIKMQDESASSTYVRHACLYPFVQNRSPWPRPFAWRSTKLTHYCARTRARRVALPRAVIGVLK